MKIKPGQAPAGGGFIDDFARNGKIHRLQPGHLTRGLTIALGIGVLATVTGCVGVVGDDGGGAVVVADPGPYWFGDWGWGGRGHDWHGDSHRGAVSRGAAHGGGGGHAGGGGHGGGGHR